MNAYIQLIPGHEAIGTIVEMGKNVKGFSIGDRCVADVGITVSLLRHTQPQKLTFLPFITISFLTVNARSDKSVILASIAVGGSLYSARTFRLVVSLRMEDSPSTSNSKPS